jgi:Spy/CpxP family protein refolding chaperone
MRARHLARMAEYLNLTDAQKEQAKAAFQQAHQEAQPVRTQLQQNRLALADAVKAGKSEAEIQGLANTTGTLVGQLVAIRTGAFAKVYATLTPEQRQKADQWRGQMKGRFQQRFGGPRTNG